MLRELADAESACLTFATYSARRATRSSATWRGARDASRIARRAAFRPPPRQWRLWRRGRVRCGSEGAEEHAFRNESIHAAPRPRSASQVRRTLIFRGFQATWHSRCIKTRTTNECIAARSTTGHTVKKDRRASSASRTRPGCQSRLRGGGWVIKTDVE
jgi:hypothetical protein